MKPEMNIRFIFILIFIKCIVGSTDLKFEWSDFNNYHTKIEFKYKDQTIFLEEYSYNSINKLIVKSNQLNYNFQLIYNSKLDHLYKIKDGLLDCDYFNIYSNDFDLENLGPLGFIYFNSTKIQNSEVVYQKIGPSVFLNLILNNELEFIKEDNNIRGLNVIVYKSKNKFNHFNLENIDLSLIFKLNDNKPIQIRASFIYKRQNFDFVFDYFNFETFDRLKKDGESIAFPIACNKIKDIHKRPDFKLENTVKIDFNDISSNDQIIRTKFFIDKKEKIIRLEKDDENVRILDMKNKVKFTANLNNKCDLEFYSSNQKFGVERNFFYKNVHLILNIGNINDYTFIGNDLERGYLREKFQIIIKTKNNLLTKKTLYFNGNNLDMLFYEEYDKNKIKRNITLEINEIKSLDYNENYRELFTMSNCELNEHLYVHLYSLPYENDLHLKEKLEYLEKNREDFVLSKLLKSLKSDTGLDLNSFSTSNLEQQSTQFVVNSKIINVENYLDSFEEIENMEKVSSYLKMDIRKCAKMVLDDKRYSGFKHCENECYLIRDNLDNKNGQNNQDCKTFRRKRNKIIDYKFHKLTSIFNFLIKNRYSIQIEHNIKFVFTKIRFSTGLNLIDNHKIFLQFKDKAKIRNPIDEFDNHNATRLISPLDCYTKCIKNDKCNSFSFCKMHNTDGKVEISCQLSDHIFLEDKQNSIINFNYSNANNKKYDKLINDNFCQTFNINYLNHFHSKGKSMIATSNSLKSQLVNSQEECARNCYSFNQDEKTKCGKIEICSKNKANNQFQCNLKPFNDDDEIELKNKSCEYFKIDYLVDYHQIELKENDNLKLVSLDEKIDDCAKSCSSIELCNEFNFCWANNLGNNDLKNEIGYCIRHEKSNFNPQKKAFNCITMMKNDKVYFNEPNNDKPKTIIEHDPNRINQRVFAIFLIVSTIFGLFLGFISFEYYNRKIAPKYRADPGTYYPTRLFINNKNDDNQNDTLSVDNKRETEIKIENQLENDVNYLKEINNLNENRKKSPITNINEDEFTDIIL